MGPGICIFGASVEFSISTSPTNPVLVAAALLYCFALQQNNYLVWKAHKSKGQSLLETSWDCLREDGSFIS